MRGAKPARMSRILELGPGAVSDVELVAALLAGSGRRQRPEDVAARLLEDGLLPLRRMSACELLGELRMRPVQAARVLAAVELGLQLMLDEAGRALGIRAVDHLVIAADGFHSARTGAGEPPRLRAVA